MLKYCNIAISIELNFETSFKFIGKNPPSILIMGGILLVLIGATTPSTWIPNISQTLQLGEWMIGIGVFLNILFLAPKYLKR